MTKTAIIAGQGGLPGLLVAALRARGQPFLLAEMEGFPADVPGETPLRFRLERLVRLLDHLAEAKVDRVVFAGSVSRPQIEPDLFDARTAQLLPRLLADLQAGDDAVLRGFSALFEDWGFTVIGADAVAPDLLPGPGLLTGELAAADRSDAARAATILQGLGALDLGQGAVVVQGLCLAVETLPGTDAMLAFARLHRARFCPDPTGGRGVFYKAPKPGQDRRFDLPVLGRETVRAVAAAGLAGIAWEAGGVLLLDREVMLAEAEALGLFLWSRAS